MKSSYQKKSSQTSLKMYDGDDKVFTTACELAQTLATRRQANKFFKQNRGKAHAFKDEAVELVHGKK